jgi:dTDP-4-amino-4,6-dideoxygalactose transaminase
MGSNSRLDAVQAAVLRIKLKYLEEWNQRRRTAAAYYRTLLAGYGAIGLPECAQGNEDVWHLYVVRVPDRDRVMKELNSHGIQAGVHYPVPVNLSEAWALSGHASGHFPVAEAAAGRILSLPLFPHITAAQQERVAKVLIEAVEGGAE